MSTLEVHGEEETEYLSDHDVDQEYVATTAIQISAALANGRAIEVAFQPGDMTFYGLVFTPLLNIQSALPRRPNEELRACRGMRYREGAVLVSYVSHASYPFDLSPGRGFLHHSYVGEKLKVAGRSAVMLTLLLRAIAAAGV